MARATANMKKPEDAIICILALNFTTAKTKQVIFDINMPIKKKYNSGISVMGKTRINMSKMMKQLIRSGMRRSYTLSR